MKKAVWITFAVALVLINVIAELVYYYADLHIAMFYRITLVFGITIIASIFVGAILLIGKLEQEKPLSGHVKDTLGADKKRS